MSDDPRPEASAADAVIEREGRGGLFRSIAHRLAGDQRTLPDEDRLPGFGRATSWLNSEPAMEWPAKTALSIPRWSRTAMSSRALVRTS